MTTRTKTGKWVPSHIGLNGNEIADSLAKSSTAEALWVDVSLTSAELSSVKRMELNARWRVPLVFWEKAWLVSPT
ncbi:hypothetical protein TNCV_2110781 [Trichonephila clavipes]|nr:hypothetical protein TNCV_2110781 [Trichonephila clavipes]